MTGAESAARPLPEGERGVSASLAVAAICLLLYLPALGCGFVSVDDPEYVIGNPLLRDLSMAKVAAMFTGLHVGWWMPLTWLSLALDYQLWGLNPLGYHLTNIVLHAVNAGLVTLVALQLCRLTGQPDSVAAARSGSGYLAAILAGLFFGLHPLRVESVAWITERKDVLNGLFVLAALASYLLYVARRASRQGRFFYWLAFACFFCSLMAKSVSVVLPALLLVLDWQPLGRLGKESPGRLVLEKWPFWLLSLLLVVLTVSGAARSSYLVTYEAFPLGQRLVVSGNAIGEYVRQLLVPLGLSPFRVIPDPIPASYTVMSLVVAAALAWLGFVGYRSRPRLTACAICFLLPLLPVLAFFQNGDQSFADRFTYLPSLAPALFLALYLYGAGTERLKGRLLLPLLLFLAVCGGLTIRQIGYWKSPETFWTRVISVEPLAISYKERGGYFLDIGRYADAVADYTAALGMVTPTLKPYEYNLYAFRGEALRRAGKYAEAAADFSTALRMKPEPVYYYHRALALQAQGAAAEAAADFRRAGPDPGPVRWLD